MRKSRFGGGGPDEGLLHIMRQPGSLLDEAESGGELGEEWGIRRFTGDRGVAPGRGRFWGPVLVGSGYYASYIMGRSPFIVGALCDGGPTTQLAAT